MKTIIFQFDNCFSNYGGRNSVVSASEFKSEDPEFDPLVGQGEGQYFCPFESTLVPDPPLCVYGMRPNLCAC